MSIVTEKTVCSYLRKALKPYQDGDIIEDSEDLSYALSVLEITIPEILSEKYSLWKDETLDAFFEESALKIAENEFEFFGMCILMSDQVLTPVYFRLTIGNEGFAAVQIKLGEKSGEEMIKIPYESDEWAACLNGRAPEEIEWMYEFDR